MMSGLKFLEGAELGPVEMLPLRRVVEDMVEDEIGDKREWRDWEGAVACLQFGHSHSSSLRNEGLRWRWESRIVNKGLHVM